MRTATWIALLATATLAGCDVPVTDDPVLAEWYRYCQVRGDLPGRDEIELGEAICARAVADDGDERTYDPPVADVTPCDDERATYDACRGS